MPKIFILIMFLVAMFIAWQEYKIYRKLEKQRLESLADLEATEEVLATENVRGDVLEVKAEAVIRKAQNDSFEEEIKGLEGKE